MVFFGKSELSIREAGIEEAVTSVENFSDARWVNNQSNTT